MLEGLEMALKILNRRLDFIKSSKYSEAYVCAFEEMKIYLEASIDRVKKGENPEYSTSIVMESDKS